jgi:hypothetical protein
MVISHELVPKPSTLGWRGYGHSTLEQSNIAFIIIVALHEAGRINDERLKAMLKSLKAGTLLRKINTYHCKINDRWYTDELMYNILLDVYWEIDTKKLPIPVSDFLEYINLYLNKKKNYCIDHLYHEFVEPYIDNIESPGNGWLIKTFNIPGLDTAYISYEEADRKYGLGSGYCCEDCDGCYGEYKRSRYRWYYAKDQEKRLSKLFNDYLDTLRTPGYKLNPRRF